MIAQLRQHGVYVKPHADIIMIKLSLQPRTI